MTSPLHDAVDETLGFIDQALERIRAGEGSELELQNVRAYLLNILELVERDPGIEAASDDLYAAARELALGDDRGDRMVRLLDASLMRFGERVTHAVPRPLGTSTAVQSGTVVGGPQIRQARELLGWPA